MPEMDQLESRIKTTIEKVGSDCKGKRDGIWTATLKRYMEELGEHEGYATCATGCEDPEWLFDLCWCDSDGKTFKGLPLVLESEWKNQRVSDLEFYYRGLVGDFQKLIVARATYHVMVFEHPNEAGCEEVVARLAQTVRDFRWSAKGDRYMFACWLWDQQRFVFRQYIH